jgi:parvulin-like peptidyl-prolyl isomerase
MRSSRWRSDLGSIVLAAVVLATMFANPPALFAQSAAKTVLVTVNRRPVTQQDLDRMFLSRRVPAEHRTALAKPFLEEMIDAELLRGFLGSKRIKANSRVVNAQIEQIRQVAAQEGDADKVLEARGYTAESLRHEFELPIAWQAWIEQTWQGDKLNAFYAERRAEFDGTKVAARQIFLKTKDPVGSPEHSAAIEQLRDIREQILRKEITFEEAAAKHSESPTKDRGGDLGEFTYSGRMPESFSKVAFALKPGEISEPFSTRAGVHLCLLVKKTPGDLALEDVRKEVLARISREQWRETAKSLRESAEIVWAK